MKNIKMMSNMSTLDRNKTVQSPQLLSVRFKKNKYANDTSLCSHLHISISIKGSETDTYHHLRESENLPNEKMYDFKKGTQKETTFSGLHAG